MKTYNRISWMNDWEGETIHYWVPVAGTDAAGFPFEIRNRVKTFKELVSDNEFYEVFFEDVTESEVDTLVKFGEQCTDGLNHRKCEGFLDIEKIKGLMIPAKDTEETTEVDGNLDHYFLPDMK